MYPQISSFHRWSYSILGGNTVNLRMAFQPCRLMLSCCLCAKRSKTSGGTLCYRNQQKISLKKKVEKPDPTRKNLYWQVADLFGSYCSITFIGLAPSHHLGWIQSNGSGRFEVERRQGPRSWEVQFHPTIGWVSSKNRMSFIIKKCGWWCSTFCWMSFISKWWIKLVHRNAMWKFTDTSDGLKLMGNGSWPVKQHKWCLWIYGRK